jgi:tetratricopeptide (TPR) repeat protein
MCMSRRELAEAANAYVWEHTGGRQRTNMTEHDIGRYERGEVHWPDDWRRVGLRRVLGAESDRELGFYPNRKTSAPPAHKLGDDEAARSASRVSAPGEERLEHVMSNPASVDLVTVAYLREAVHRIDARYDNAPSLELVGEASQQYARAAFLSVNAPSGLARRDLLTALAESAILMGQIVWDGSQRQDSDVAVQYFDQAIDAARQVGHPVAEARALLRKSFVALYGTKNPRTGLELATAADDTGARSSEVISGLALLHVAEAHAMRGERRACEGALACAETHLARAKPTDVAWELFSPAHLNRLAGSCYLFLGDYDRAQHILEESVGSRGAPRTKSATITAANLSLAYIHQRKIDEAVAALHRAIDGIATTRGGGGINLAFAAGRALHRWRQEPAVYEVQDRLWELMTTEGDHG